ncbi:MAG: hypothetical protein K5872_04410 [Rhizobiaceae bacterium]|nr:hypothetical protein [Rhizobiaceae bacterium]MCV0405454.1 hypothetical protein [Rhizobiaceae bacterium]
MSKKKPAAPAKTPAAKAADTTEQPKKRSVLTLALLVVTPLVLAGGGFAGWTFFLTDKAGGEAHAGAAADGQAAGEGGSAGEAMLHTSALPPEIAAETSFTYSYALGELLAERCGRLRLSALAAASEAEAKADGMLVHLSWQAAHRRTLTVTARSCDFLRAEIYSAETRAARKAEEAEAAEGKGGKTAGH